VQVPTGPSRLTDPSSNNRWTWWTQAWEIFEEEPVAGVGAGAYELARRPLREDTQAPLDAHDIALTALAETGIVGFLLLAAFAAAAAWASMGALRTGRGAAAALVAAALAYAAQALVDMPWQYVAVSAPFFLVLGSLARREEAPRKPDVLPALAVGGVAVALIASLASPALAERRLDVSFDALAEGDVRAARDAAGQAQALNPLAVDPLLLEAAAAEAEGDYAGAERLLRRAVRLQPRNARTWYELARFELEARGDLEEALVYADRSYALDSWPHVTGDLLNDIRAELARRSGSE
jgi:tetratricopeptide (TPR) repeat protein